MKLEDIIKLRNMTVFPVCVNCTASEQSIIKRVYPLMQNQILSVLRLSFPSDVEIILFGSSLTMRCNVCSDIDLAVKTANYDIDIFHSIREKIENCISVDCDVIYYNDLRETDKIIDEINNGLLLKE